MFHLEKQRTMMMEQRCELLRQMGTKDIGSIAEESRKVSVGESSLKKGQMGLMDNNMTWSPSHQPLETVSSIAFDQVETIIVTEGYTQVNQLS